MFAGDFNRNVQEYEYNKKFKSFFNLMYQRNLIPTIKKHGILTLQKDRGTILLGLGKP